MSYSLRNTIILLVVLLLLGGSGWGYITFKMDPIIEELQSTAQEKQKQLTTMQTAVEGFEILRKQLAEAKIRLNNYPKELFPTGDHSLIYGFLNNANQDRAYIRTNIVSRETQLMETHGILTTEYEGTGRYSNLFRFINAVEHSRPINKISELEMVAVNNIEQLGEVNLTMTMQSYFDIDTTKTAKRNLMEVTAAKVNLRRLPSTSSEVLEQLSQGQQVKFVTENLNWVKVMTRDYTGWIANLYVKPVEFSSMLTVNRPDNFIYHSLFYPLIHEVPPNTEGLIDAEQSKLIGISGDKIFLMDQKGTLQELRAGDEVYLGTLSSINQQAQSATFVLNKGGIIESYEMQIQQQPENPESP